MRHLALSDDQGCFFCGNSMLATMVAVCLASAAAKAMLYAFFPDQETGELNAKRDQEKCGGISVGLYILGPWLFATVGVWWCNGDCLGLQGSRWDLAPGAA